MNSCTQNTDRECREEDCCLNRPQVIKYIDQEMPIIISTCHYCHIELFRSMTYEHKSMHKSLCFPCIDILERKAQKLDEFMHHYDNACK